MDNKERSLQLIEALRNGISETGRLIIDIKGGLSECARLLRIEQNADILTLLAGRLSNLSHLNDFIGELRKGIEQLNLQGYNISGTDLSHWDKSIRLFKDMLSALEAKDWITLSDLIQYELDPFLIEGERGLSHLLEALKKYS
ncbi:MAG: hypothetical protein HY756_04375 [Nitrospirae bacterium]|nr:hypothetical protein [Nitrospirota bacterium]